MRTHSRHPAKPAWLFKTEHAHCQACSFFVSRRKPAPSPKNRASRAQCGLRLGRLPADDDLAAAPFSIAVRRSEESACPATQIFDLSQNKQPASPASCADLTHRQCRDARCAPNSWGRVFLGSFPGPKRINRHNRRFRQPGDKQDRGLIGLMAPEKAVILRGHGSNFYL